MAQKMGILLTENWSHVDLLVYSMRHKRQITMRGTTTRAAAIFDSADSGQFATPIFEKLDVDDHFVWGDPKHAVEDVFNVSCEYAASVLLYQIHSFNKSLTISLQ
jgi:hypothetical protein